MTARRVGEPSRAAGRPNPVRRRILLSLVVTLLVVCGLAACGDGDDQEARTSGADRSTTSTTAEDGTTSSSRSPDRTPTTEPRSEGDRDQPGDGHGPPPRPADQTLVVLDVHGGFVPVERAVGGTAELVLAGDGTVISPAPTVAIYPGPALPPFQVGRVTAADVAGVVDAVAALPEGADYRSPRDRMVADAPSTTVRLVRDGRTVEHTAYALGFEDETGPRAALAAVVQRLHELADGAGSVAYEPRALRVHDVTEQSGATGPSRDAGQPSGQVLDWPIAHDGRACTVVDDPVPVAAVLPVVRQATQLDWFRTAAGIRRLVVVPLLPGDPGCR